MNLDFISYKSKKEQIHKIKNLMCLPFLFAFRVMRLTVTRRYQNKSLGRVMAVSDTPSASPSISDVSEVSETFAVPVPVVACSVSQVSVPSSDLGELS